MVGQQQLTSLPAVNLGTSYPILFQSLRNSICWCWYSIGFRQLIFSGKCWQMLSEIDQIAEFIIEQESPPAWTQEAYHPPCIKYSSAVPSRGVGYPHPALAMRVPPSWSGWGYPQEMGVPLSWEMGVPTPVRRWGYPPLGTCREMGIPPCEQTHGQTRVKTLPSPFLRNAGGN